MRCRDLIEGLDLQLLSGSLDVEIGGVQHDSRRVRPGDLFVAIKGFKTDGHDFIQEVLTRGAAGLIIERRDLPLPSTLPVLLTKDTRRALAFVSARFHGEPSKQLILIGVTGTNGKTTTTYLIEAILKEAGWKAGLVGTVSYRFGGTVVPAERTTPESSDLQAFLAEILKKRAKAAILEVSSHSLALHRVEACDFDVAVFTNLTQDHLDFHGTLEAYRDANTNLFEGLHDRATKGVEKAAFLNA
ncbi:MAG: UDP-N-acetylmuramoyl-L-alanyl-D-glutamate--2,6-diaminopimelate ligase, partial [candidate division NC10 bacterium]|nr:UDP-N-acetylmuramoyl-L-alanyl-D-glutamate--2,6-diaminopimelate ligase [candidate division NC10 bacterium]